MLLTIRVSTPLTLLAHLLPNLNHCFMVTQALSIFLLLLLILVYLHTLSTATVSGTSQYFIPHPKHHVGTVPSTIIFKLLKFERPSSLSQFLHMMRLKLSHNKLLAQQQFGRKPGFLIPYLVLFLVHSIRQL